MTSKAGTQFNNDGKDKLSVPGFGQPVYIQLDADGLEKNRFAHGANDWIQDPRLTVRELAMLKLMDALTDKPNWNEKVFDEDIVEKWHREASTMPLISEKAWEWCLAELRDKANAFEKDGFVSTYNAGCGCVKTDTLVPESLRGEIVQAVQPLLDSPEKDWHPNSNEQVLNLVHPSLFPLVYGKSRVMKTGQVGVDNFMDAYGQGEVCEVPGLIIGESESTSRDVNAQQTPSLWSTKFQWLPCDVEFQGDSGTDVTIASYINNLHPKKYKVLYGIIEKLISLSIPLWNKAVAYPLECQTPPRIRTYGAGFEPEYPEWIEWGATKKMLGEAKFQELLEKTREFLTLPDNPDFEDTDDEEVLNDDQSYRDGTWEQEENLYLNSVVDWKYKRVRKVGHPEPGIAYSYSDWKNGNVDGAIVKPYDGRVPIFHRLKTLSINLEQQFRDCGLQVIVKLASIELSPEKPTYEGGNWHIEGLLNEHIAATAIYYYDVSNTTESRIRFRQEAELDDGDMTYEQDDHEPLCEIFGTESMRDEPAVQELGSIATPQGRLLVFPNTLQHCVQPFELVDRSRPGHRRFIVLWLVDPHYRIASTRNVPPQRHDWWAPHGYHQVGLDQKLPTELSLMVKDEIKEWPMGMEEAKELRLELMAERTNLMPRIESGFEEYNFCEH